jgi:class 3 adenylate cyclase
MAEIRSEVPLIELAETVDAYYEHVGAAVRAGGGRVVKFEGDAARWATNGDPCLT